jgi:hypothetical protein
MRYKRFAVVFTVVAIICSLTGTRSRAEPLYGITDKPSGVAAPAPCSAQPVLASGLLTPTKLIFTQQGNLLVAEAGSGSNTGRISIIDPATGHRRTLLDGLPSGLTGPNSPPSGPSGLAMRGRTLYVTIGGGDATLPGAAPDSRIPNPNPSSPIFSAVLAVDFAPRAEQTTAGFALAYGDHLSLQGGAEVNLGNGEDDKIRVRRVADFPDYTLEPRTGEPNNVRPSDPFGLVISANQLYIVDSDSNAIRAVDLQTNEATTLITFAPLSPGGAAEGVAGSVIPGGNVLSNSLTAPSPASVEAIPASIRFYGDQLLVTTLTGSPFPTAAAQVRIVDPATGSDAPFITGLSMAADVLPLRGRGRTSEFLTLELSAEPRVGAPGRLRRYTSPDAAPVVVAECLNSPTSMARDERTGELFITEIFIGRIVKVPAPATPNVANSVFGFEPQPISATAR